MTQRRIDPLANILPYDGHAYDTGELLSPTQADDSYNQLRQQIDWEQDETVLFGRRHITKRLVAWYADTSTSYTYSNVTKVAKPWTEHLLELKALVEMATYQTFNSCLLNLYHSGDEGMGWHCDNEKELQPDGMIASLSLGAERKFAFKHKKTKETRSLLLRTGSLLIMEPPTQQHWLHRLPPTKLIKEARINLTFRQMK